MSRQDPELAHQRSAAREGTRVIRDRHQPGGKKYDILGGSMKRYITFVFMMIFGSMTCLGAITAYANVDFDPDPVDQPPENPTPPVENPEPEPPIQNPQPENPPIESPKENPKPEEPKPVEQPQPEKPEPPVKDETPIPPVKDKNQEKSKQESKQEFNQEKKQAESSLASKGEVNEESKEKEEKVKNTVEGEEEPRTRDGVKMVKTGSPYPSMILLSIGLMGLGATTMFRFWGHFQ